MNCAVHPERPGVSQCSQCGKALCESCQVELASGSYCRECLEERVAQTPDAHTAATPAPDAHSPDVRTISPKSPFLAFIFSLVPGVGHMYLELMQRGLSIMITFFGAIAVTAGFNGPEVAILVLPVLYFYSVFDALQLRRRINTGENVADKALYTWRQVEGWLSLRPGQTQTLLAYVLILYGGLKLVQNWLPPLTFFGARYSLHSVTMFPLLLILAGVWILSGLKRGRGAGDSIS